MKLHQLLENQFVEIEQDDDDRLEAMKHRHEALHDIEYKLNDTISKIENQLNQFGSDVILPNKQYYRREDMGGGLISVLTTSMFTEINPTTTQLVNRLKPLCKCLNRIHNQLAVLSVAKKELVDKIGSSLDSQVWIPKINQKN